MVPPKNQDFPLPVLACQDEHVTFPFLPCQSPSLQVYLSDNFTAIKKPVQEEIPSFTCDNGVQQVPYTLLCDHRQECSDNSDEDFCQFQPCSGSTPLQCGSSKQCIRLDQWCDGQSDCFNGIDQLGCVNSIVHTDATGLYSSLPPPAVVHLDPTSESRISVTMTPLPTNPVGVPYCPETHFQCPGDGFCLPVFVRCNGVTDCPNGEDEKDCSSYTCPGLYRCRGSTICLHALHVCDGLKQCPLYDDELYCHLTCPTNCTCLGLVFMCPRDFPVYTFTDLRYLDARESGLTLLNLTQNLMLVHVSLARCGLSQLAAVTLPNLRSLDLSDNNIHLSFLNLSHNGIQRVTGTFRALNMLKVLDIRGCPLIYIQKDVLKDQEHLQQLYADNYKLCCSATLPAGFSLNNCRAPFDEVSSCESLLRSDLYRVALAVFSAFSVLGNLGSFFARIFVWKTGSKSGFGVFVFHLCVSDFVMGVYLAIIGLADHLYRGIYLWEDIYWRNSAACKVAGFLSLLSSEVSAFIVCFITLDRFLVLRFPLSGLHFSNTTAHVTCAVTWLVGMMLAAVPLTQHWEFYSQTGICIPLPITRTGFAGRTYSFGIMIVLNFVLFLLIAAGQIFIYSSIRANRMSLGTDSVRKDQDVNIARRLITIAVSDFLCWFPIGLLGLLASGDVPIPGELNVAMAILVLPLNSALNPFLYNLNMVLERRRKAKEQQLFKALESHVLL
ncbi:G-protein coupled receptor GRL101-like [Littorina saxatilis]|uniref:G-protein coupled receptor GRL101-like n=1 Tax=Littorina saxatilis TaxID=31220 RepID=UPI0038B530ED